MPDEWREVFAFELSHARVRWSIAPTDLVAEPVHRGLAVAAVYSDESHWEWDRLQGDGSRRKSQKYGRSVAGHWGFDDRPSLLATIVSVLVDGHHPAHRMLIDEYLAMIESDTLPPPAERPWTMRQVVDDNRGVRDLDGTAYDLVRAANLCRVGVALDWMTETEAEDTFLWIMATLQEHYSSWTEMMESYGLGRWFWQEPDDANDGEETRADLLQYARVVSLTDPVTGPWRHLPWNTPLPESRLLLFDALIAEGVR